MRRMLPADIVSLWIPDGYNKAKDIIRGNHGTCFETPPLVDGGLNLWDDENNLTNWLETISGGSTVNREATEKVEGAYSCRLDVDASNSHVVLSQRDIPLVPLRGYKLVIWYMNSAEGKSTHLAFRDKAANVWLKEDGTWNVSDYGIMLPNSTIWKKYELVFYAHADYSLYYIWLYEHVAPSSSIYIDNISIKELTPSLLNTFVGWRFGGDDYVEIPDNPSLNFGATGDFTIGAVIKTLDVGTLMCVVDKSILSSPAKGYSLYKDTSDKVVFVYFDGAAPSPTLVGTSLVNDGKWHIPIVVWRADNSERKLYVDGVVEDAISSRANSGEDSGYNLRIGASSLAGYNFYGDIALPFIVKGAWSQQQVNNFILNIKGMFSPRG